MSIDAVSAILAEKVSAAEEAARVKAEQEAAAAAHAAEVAELQRQRTWPTNNAGKNSASTGPISPSEIVYPPRLRNAQESRLAAERAAWTRRARSSRQIANTKAEAGRSRGESGATQSEEAERRRQMKQRDAARLAATSAIRKRIDAALDRLHDEGAGAGGRLRGVADG